MREILIKKNTGMWPFKNLRDPIFRHDKKETKEITTTTGKKDEVAVKTANGQTLADHIRIPGKYEWRRIERGNNSVACNQSTTFPSIHILNRDFTDVRIAETRRANAKCLYLFTSNRRIWSHSTTLTASVTAVTCSLVTKMKLNIIWRTYFWKSILNL